ncbi:3-beta hydroxysteroid dehydrogenase [Rhodococcus sp. Leaf7]|uniref:SDR family oxidoreductase n=1 Tax=unclassified Rhodococcus (in: high G+C Gram-positive bacteria) TaxID=192944 RepID=UPI0006FB3B9C|nr:MULTISPECIES: NAD(P)H-binding protein [unclassified Rhodococcus (in: high G+C Gram-positive bacteria)]KQU06395.1 3-beta hydroxysteroid dehydrogenase [Rhodococcus sp. Leaf7]KQU41913.1 3-beta hydroxysteroid dehydrogenase [Rhodococcus sp. Leaf247]
MRIAVAGGTGAAGRLVVDRLRTLGHTPVVLARSVGIDLTRPTPELDDALAGVDAVIDASNVTTMSASKSEAFFGAVTTTLLRAGERAGIGHHVALSIVGCDRVDYGYYAGKRLQEKLVRESAVPWTILRATQFHEFTDQALAMTPGPIAMIPTMRSQPVSVAEVAAHIVDLAVAQPLSAVVEFAGPQPEYQPDLARRVLRARGSRRLVVPLRLPGAGGRGMANGGLLPAPGGPQGVETFEQWLDRDVAPSR